jgi:hypothetical protein
MTEESLELDEEQLLSFYPDRFVGARVLDEETHDYTLVDLDAVRSGIYCAARQKNPRAGAAASTTQRKRAQREETIADGSDDDDGDDDDDDDRQTTGAEKAATNSTAQSATNKRKRAAPLLGSRLRSALRYSAKRSRARILKSMPVTQVEQPSIVTLTSREVAWSMTEVYMVEYISKRVPMVAACMATIKNHVLREGIRFTRDMDELIPSTEFQQYVAQRLVPFCYQCLDAILLLGLVPILYEREERSGQPWPYVPAIGTYVIKRHTVAGAVRLRFYWRNNSLQNAAWQRQVLRTRDQQGLEAWVARRQYEPRSPEQSDEAGGIYDPTVEIVHGFGYDMTTDGLLGSKVATLLQMVDQRSRHMFARATGEMNAANPPIFTEYNFAAEKQGSKPFQTGYYTSASVPLDMAGANGTQDIDGLASRTYTRDSAQREAYAGLLRTYEHDTGASAAATFGVQPEEYKSDLGGTALVQNAFTADGHPQPWQRQFHVSSSRQLRQGPTAHVSTDYVSVLQHLDDEVCAVFGVPRTYLLGTSIRAGTDLVASRLGEEISAYKKICGDILTHIYQMLFLNDDLRSYLTSEQRANRRRRNLQPRFSASSARTPSAAKAGADTDGIGPVTEEDLFVSEAIGSVQVSFPKNPVERIDELQQLYALGAISVTVFCTEIARRNNIEPGQLFLEQNSDAKVTREMRQMGFAPYADNIRLQHAERMEAQRIEAAADLADKAHAAAAKAAKITAAAKPPPPAAAAANKTAATGSASEAATKNTKSPDKDSD